jgi:recombination protein U
MTVNYANKGRGFEEQIIASCKHYRQEGAAVIQKIATPWTVIRKGSRIVNAFPSGPSTVDFCGDFKGRSIAFEAKSTKNRTNIPLGLFESHQMAFLRSWEGIAFAIVEASALNEVRIIPIEILLSWWDGYMMRKSIPMSTFLSFPKVERNKHGFLDFLEGVKQIERNAAEQSRTKALG